MPPRFACRANGIAGDTIILDRAGRQTDASNGDLGTVTFAGRPAGGYTVAEAVMAGNFADYRVFCSDVANTQMHVDYRGSVRAAVAITLEQDAVVICDRYNIPPQTVATVTDMPVAGTGPLGGQRVLELNLGILVGGSLLLAASAWLLRRPDDVR